jgi:hypothetical protein
MFFYPNFLISMTRLTGAEVTQAYGETGLFFWNKIRRKNISIVPNSVQDRRAGRSASSPLRKEDLDYPLLGPPLQK